MKKLSTRGFTLIELLIVIAVLGVLATILLVAVDPVQQLARGRDASRLATIVSLGRALEAYAVARGGDYPNGGGSGGGTWITDLVDAGEIKRAPSRINYVSEPTNCYVSSLNYHNSQNGYCYDPTTAGGGTPVIIYVRLEAKANTSRCGDNNPDTIDTTYAVYASLDGRAGIVCTHGAAQEVPTLSGRNLQPFLP